MKARTTGKTTAQLLWVKRHIEKGNKVTVLGLDSPLYYLSRLRGMGVDADVLPIITTDKKTGDIRGRGYNFFINTP